MKKLRAALLGMAAIVAVLLYVFLPGRQRSESARGPASTERTVVAGAPGAPDVGEARNDEVEEKDFQSLADAAMKIKDPARRQEVLAGILTEWLRSDPLGVGKYVMRLEVETSTKKLTILANALNDVLATLPPETVASSAVRDPLRRLTAHLARHDPDMALTFADTWLDGDPRDAAMVDIARAFALRSPAEGVALASRITSPLRHMQAFAVVGGVWARTDPAAASAWAARIVVPTERAVVMNAVLTSIAQSDPASAASYLTTAEQVIGDQYRDQYLRDLAAMNVTEADLANDPEKYLEMLEIGEIPPPSSPDAELMADAARLIASKLASERPAAGVEWAESLENQFLKMRAIEGAMAGWSRSDPEAAAAFAAANYPRYREVLTTVYEVWADDAPANAADATRLLQDPALRAAATETVVKTWAVTDASDAAAWVDRLPADDQTDAIRFALVTAMSSSDPVGAWNRAQAIGDASMQYRALKAAFSEVVIRNPDTAAELLASATLSERNAERLHAILDATQG